MMRRADLRHVLFIHRYECSKCGSVLRAASSPIILTDCPAGSHHVWIEVE